MKIALTLSLILFTTAHCVFATVHQIDIIGTAGPGLLPGNEPGAITGGTGGEIGPGITYDDVNRLLTISNVGWGSSQGFTNLTSTATASHIHGPTAANFGNNAGNFKQTAGVVFNITRSSSAVTGGTFTDTPLLLTAAQQTDLLNGKYYINIHTSNNGGGELRGFLVAVPTVTAISPSAGTIFGGTTVTITGTNFTGTTNVIIGGEIALDIVVSNNTTITATTRPRAVGIVDVVVTTPGGTATGPNLYTYNAAPTISGMIPGQPVNDNATVAPFTTITFADANVPTQTQAVSVTLDNTAKGSFTPASLTASGFVNAGSGVHTFSGTAAAATAAIRLLVFAPTANRVPPGNKELTTFTLSINDGIAAPVTSSFTTVESTSINELPTLNAIPNPSAILEDAAEQTITLSGITAGLAESQTLVVTAISANTQLIPDPTVTYTGPNTTGSIRYTPAPNEFGTTTITVTVNDGINTFSRTFDVIVAPVNDLPTLNPILNPAAILEDAAQQEVVFDEVRAGNFESQTLTVTATSTNTALIPHPSISYVSPSTIGVLRYTPLANANGTATITVTVNDGQATNNTVTRTFDVTVTPGNDPPSFTKGADQTVPANAGPRTVAAWATAISTGPADEAAQTVSFSITGNDAPSLFSAGPAIAPNGTLTYTPAVTANGGALISVRLTDNGGGDDTSEEKVFVIVVTAANSQPSFDSISNQNILEDAAQQTVSLTGISAGAGETQPLTITAVSSNTAVVPNPTVTYTSPNATGSLTYTPLANAFGTATITVTVNDGQVVDNTFSRTFDITVNAVNDAPSFTKGADEFVLLNSGAQTVASWATAISPGPANESTQTVSFAITNNTNPALFSAGPAIASNGTLTYTPATSALGTATISVQANDNGAIVASSPVQTFAITVSSTLLQNYTITTSSGVLTITDDSGNADTLSLSAPSAGNIAFVAPGRRFSLNGAAQTTGSSGTISLSGITSIIVNAGAGADIINVGSFTAFPSLTINGGTSDDTLTFTGGITFAANANLDLDLQNDAAPVGRDSVLLQLGADLITTGTGTITVRVSGGISIIQDSSLETQDGNLTVEANQQTPSSSGAFTGITVSEGGSMIRSTGSAVVTVKGKGGDHSVGNQHGVHVRNGAAIIGGTGGLVEVVGIGGDSTGFINPGVAVTGGMISSSGAEVIVTGTGGANGSDYGAGVTVSNGGTISSASSEPLEITGTGAGASDSGFNNGVELSGSGGTITSSTGSVNIKGTPGPGTPVGLGGSWGVLVDTSSTVSQTGSRFIFITAPSVSIDPSANITATHASSSVRFQSANTIGLGVVDAIGTLGLTDAELDRVTTPLLEFRTSAAVPTRITSPITRSVATDIRLSSIDEDGLLQAENSGSDIDTAGGTLRPNQTLSMPITDQLPDTGFPQLSVTGLIDLDGNLLDLSGTTNPNAGLLDSYVIVNNDGTDAITGTFHGLPEGTQIPWPPNPALAAQISYIGGTGNDVMLTIVNPLEVTTAADSGPGSLRQAIANAAAAPGENTILFNPSFSPIIITLTSEITLNDPDGIIIDADASALSIKIQPAAGHRIFNVTGGSATLRGLWLANGSPTGDGGAILNSGTLTLDSCTFSGNSASAGGAIQNISNINAVICTFSENTSLSSGGAINNDDHGFVSLTHCTIVGNHSGTLGSITHNGHHPIVLANCIVWGDSGLFSISGETERSGNNICETFTTTPPGSGPAFLVADPKLSNLGSYGGLTPTMPPQIGSPATDQAAVLFTPLTTDQRGFPRPKGIRPDIGAVEGSMLIVTTPADELATPGAGYSLREAVRDAAANEIIMFDRAIFTGPTTLTLTLGPLNPQQNCTLDASNIPGGISIVTQFTITQQPQPQNVGQGATATFSILVTDVDNAVAYSWRKNESPLAATLNNISIPSAQNSDEGVYDVVLSERTAPGVLTLTNVTKLPATAISQPATLIAGNPPFLIMRHPKSAMLAVGSSHTLSVIASAPAPLTFQWKKGGVKVAGGTKSTLTFAKTALSHAGTYTCEVKSEGNLLTTDAADIGVVDRLSKTVTIAVGKPFTASVKATGTGLSYSWNTGQTTSSFTITPTTSASGPYICTVTGNGGTLTGGTTTLNVTEALPQLGTFAPPPAVIGQTYFYKVPVQNIPGAPATSFSLTSALPKGITFNKTTGVLSGRPTTSRLTGFPLTVKAINSKGPSAPATATLNVNIVPSTAVGTFAGPIERSSLNADLGGRFDLTTTATGTFSGSITLGATKRSFKSQLLLSSGPGDVILLGNIPLLKDTSNRPLTAYIEVFATQQIARLTLINFMFSTYQSDAWRKVPTATAATYTLRLDPGTVTDAPHGYGFSTLKATATNTVTISGKLPDNTALTGSTFIGPDGQILIYHRLYKNKGTLVGQHQLLGTALTGTLTWSKPLTTGTTYPAAFGSITVTTEGGKYTPPTAGQLAMPAASKLTFSDGGLAAPGFTQLVTIANPKPTGLTNTAMPSLPLVNTTSILSFSASSGAFAGSFMIPGATTALNRPAPFFGQLVRIGGTTQGYGYFLLPQVPVGTEKVSTAPKLSGRVLLSVP
jgi:hypothetical protein